MILRKLAFVLVILFFIIIAISMFADLANTEKKIDKLRKKNNTKTNSKKSIHH